MNSRFILMECEIYSELGVILYFSVRYCGYCPQYKYNHGKSYGKMTLSLLSNPEISHSGHHVLQNTKFDDEKYSIERRHYVDLLNSRRPRYGEQKLTSSMIPGYTGFVPKSQNYFAKTYAETCRDSLTDFERGQRQFAVEKEELLSASYTPKLVSIARDAKPYISPHAFKDPGSPYYMENDNPYKYFMSGYTGYVPRSRFMIGTGYPITTNHAIQEFSGMPTDKTYKGPEELETLQKEKKTLPPLKHIYPMDLGLLPRYTGYVPGYKFQFGHTYGQLTHDALGSSTLQKQVAI
ncbi:protein FAM166B [Protopterus annectens]|uniref:protein FAM166B n=1 Tax=Protopterus annectens TaxID=7888 RepID=UPI001CFB225B|nr:protein FAM166B [Protopterus annectens]